MELYQTKGFCTVKETIIKMKKTPTEWKNIFWQGELDEGSQKIQTSSYKIGKYKGYNVHD